MANSKANIYPIQLQGAQLNLNQFDAEIKQYSGFNKNNSPFVGGCLSPVFTKDEAHSGYTRNNTYIDTNGDVYHVDTSGLYKNDTKVLDTTGATFYDVVKSKQFPDDVIYIYSEDVYVYGNKVTDNFSTTSGINIHFYGQERNILADINDLTNPVHIILNLEVFVYIKIGTIGNSKYLFVVGTGVFFVIAYRIDETDEEKTLVPVAALTYNSSLVTAWSSLDLEPILQPTLVIKENSTISDAKIWLFFGKGSGNATNLIIDFFNESFTGIWAYLEGNIQGYNYAVAMKDGSYDAVAYCLPRLPGSYPTSLIANLLLNWNNGSITVYPLGSVNFSGLTKNGVVVKYLKPWGVAYSAYMYASTNDLRAVVVNRKKSDCGTISYINGVKTSVIGFGIVLNDCVLLNNGVVSGVCLPNGYVLATEWNTVDGDSIYFGENTEEWRQNNFVCIWQDLNTKEWYKLIKSTPKLRFVNNQVVINADNLFNSYDIQSEKKLLFAPAWNNRYIFSNKSSLSANSNPDRFFASSINEYNLKDNASLLLNPIRARISRSESRYLERYVDNGIVVNYYNGEDEAVYVASESLSKNYTFYDEDLALFPFPSNVDGNIQYSPSLFSEIKSVYGNEMFIKNGNTFYPLMKGNNNEPVMSFFLASGIDNLQEGFVIQGQFYGIINNGLYSIQYSDGVLSNVVFVVDVTGLKFCGNTPYQAFFFSKTNRCLYSFTGANAMNQAQFLDKFEDVTNYEYNPATQTIFMITASEVIAYSSFGIYEIFFANVSEVYILEKGICMLDNSGNFKYLQYYSDTGYDKQNITLETCFYGTNDQTVSINDCLYIRLFDENHAAGNLVISASTLTNEGRTTEDTTFKIKASDWDELTHSIYIRYQPKEQRGLGVSFSINSPFKIASLSVGSMPDAILIDKVSKGAINAPYKTTSNKEW